MAGFICPYCKMTMAITNTSKSVQYPSFDRRSGITYFTDTAEYDSSTLEITFFCCPNCGEYTIVATGVGDSVKDVSMAIRPTSSAIQFPEYIPRQIREDYEEACAVLQLSPKSSATLARRCLQGMIRDFWGIVKPRLYDEITALKATIQPDLWQAIDGLRQLGNIGAHMEKDTNLMIDIDPGEAEKLIKLIELLMEEWYINREKRNKLFGDIMQITADKKAIKHREG